MLKSVFRKLRDNQNKREIKNIIHQINQLSSSISSLKDEELQEKTYEFRDRLSYDETLDGLLVEAYTVVREAAFRVLYQRHYDSELLGAIALHQGRIIGMKNGEGKTLTATMPAYLNALDGNGVHIITSNDYLAMRDFDWMGDVYAFLGLSVGLILNEMDMEEKKQSYDSDITYGECDAFVFDYLRDNLALSEYMKVQRKLSYAIIDEADSILIDKARTPLILVDTPQMPVELYLTIDRIIPYLKEVIDYRVNDRNRRNGDIILTETGIANVERLMEINNLYSMENINILHYTKQALMAYIFYKRDIDYLVIDNEVIIIDETTGRLLPNRKWSGGLHQAIEAKEGVTITEETVINAKITYQNYFRLYEKISGMANTVEFDAEEFSSTYNMPVLSIPTNKPVIRKDFQDVIYKTEKEKFYAVLNEILEMHRIGRPVLIGTRTIEKSEKLSELLRRRNITHNVLNAKNYDEEAEILNHAGELGAVTIITNMAGQGIDIVLGDGVNELGGLHVIGTERHDSRRLDNQLRDQAGRQGEPGSSRFILSLEDELFKKFITEKFSNTMDWLGFGNGVPIEHKWITKSIEIAQRRIEDFNLQVRKNLLRYDDLLDKQRAIIYQQRNMVLESLYLKDMVLDMLDGVVDDYLNNLSKIYGGTEQYFQELDRWIKQKFHLDISSRYMKLDSSSLIDMKNRILDYLHKFYDEKEKQAGSETMRILENYVILDRIDKNWINHLGNMDYAESIIGLYGYPSKDPFSGFEQEAHEIFTIMNKRIREEVVEYIFKLELVKREP